MEEKPRSKTRGFRKAVLEFIPVFLGVILALFFDNLNESRLDQKKINGLLVKIELGTEKNIENLELQLSRNQQVIDSLTHYQQDNSLRIGDILSRTKGIRHIQFDLAAWSVLKSSELLVDVDYELVSYLYLLSESISQSADLTIKYNATDPEAKEELISDLDDYLVAINDQKYMSEQILKILKAKK